MAFTDNCRATVKNLDCGSELPTQQPNTYPAFSVCLPFGRMLEWDGTGMRLSGSYTISDGRYGIVRVANGCIVDAEEQPVCEYTPQPCTPAASPCSGDGSSSISLISGLQNLLYFDATGALGAVLHVEGQDGITVSGYGTASSPLIISFDSSTEDTKTYINAGDLYLNISGSGSVTDPYQISHAVTTLGAGTYGGFTVDGAGHITGYEAQDLGITNVQSNGNISATKSGVTLTLTMDQQNSAGTYVMGGYSVTVDTYGVVTGISQAISLTPSSGSANAVLDVGKYTLSFNQLGSLVGYAENSTASVSSRFVELFFGTRTTTTIQFTSTENAYLLIEYEGYLPAVTSASSDSWYASGDPKWVSLSDPYQLYIDGKKVNAYCQLVKVSSTSAYAIRKIMILTDAFYAAGKHTVQILNTSQDDQFSNYAFSDNGVLSVSLVGKGEE